MWTPPDGLLQHRRGDLLVVADTLELVRASGAGGAVPLLSFTSTDFSDYDHFGRPTEVDWYQPG